MNVRDRSPVVLHKGRWVKDSVGVMRWDPELKPNPDPDKHDSRGMPWCSRRSQEKRRMLDD